MDQDLNGGLEVERLLHKLHDSTSVGSNPTRRQKDLYIKEGGSITWCLNTGLKIPKNYFFGLLIEWHLNTRLKVQVQYSDVYSNQKFIIWIPAA